MTGTTGESGHWEGHRSQIGTLFATQCLRVPQTKIQNPYFGRMQTLHLIGGEKGGVGKSVVSRVLCQYHIDHERPFAAFDGDGSHPALLRYYAEFSEPVTLADFESSDRLVMAALEKSNAVVDLPAQSENAVGAWLDDSGVGELADDIGLRLVRWHVMDDGKDSLLLLGRLLEQPRQGSDLVVVRNHGRGKDFDWTAGSDATKAAAESGASFVDFPALHAGTMSKIDRIDASFWAASNNKDPSLGPCLNLLERQRVKVWLRRAYAQLAAAHPSLAPADSGTAASA